MVRRGGVHVYESLHGEFQCPYGRLESFRGEDQRSFPTAVVCRFQLSGEGREFLAGREMVDLPDAERFLRQSGERGGCLFRSGSEGRYYRCREEGELSGDRGAEEPEFEVGKELLDELGFGVRAFQPEGVRFVGILLQEGCGFVG